MSTLNRELTAHAAGEERFSYLPLSAHDMVREFFPDGTAEHRQIDWLIKTLEFSHPGSPAWLVRAQALHRKGPHHLDFGERSRFLLADKVPGSAESVSLALQYEGEFVVQRMEAGKFGELNG